MQSLRHFKRYIARVGFWKYIFLTAPGLVITILSFLVVYKPVTDFFNQQPYWTVGIIIVLLLVQIFSEVVRTNEMEEIKKRADESEELVGNYSEIIDSNLDSFVKLMAKDLKLTENDRISFYYRDKIEEDFVLISRYSQSPTFNQRNREKYPKNKGYISKCWSEGTPHFYKDSIRFNDSYYQEINMSRAEVDSLRMKSKSFFIYNIKRQNEDDSVGVFVIESTNSKIAHYQDKSMLLSAIKHEKIEYVYGLMSNLRRKIR